jgi:hypothetical protein
LACLYLRKFDELLVLFGESGFSLVSGIREKVIKDHIEKLKLLSEMPSNCDIFNEAVRSIIAKVTWTESGLDQQIDDTFRPMLDRIDQLANRLEEVDKRKRPIRHHLLYVILTVLLAVVTGVLVHWGWFSTPDVQINWDIGNIIQGVAVGIAALLAAVTYAHHD